MSEAAHGRAPTRGNEVQPEGQEPSGGHGVNLEGVDLQGAQVTASHVAAVVGHNAQEAWQELKGLEAFEAHVDRTLGAMGVDRGCFIGLEAQLGALELASKMEFVDPSIGELCSLGSPIVALAQTREAAVGIMQT